MKREMECYESLLYAFAFGCRPPPLLLIALDAQE